MKKFFILSVAATLICSFSFATIRRVGYPGPQVTGTDYTDAATAVTASAANDTIQLYPGVSATIVDLNKALVFLGPGYLLNINSGLQVATNSARLDLSLIAGASNSTFEGLTITWASWLVSNMVANTTLQNVTFKRCLLSAPGSTFYMSGTNAGVQGITFSQCIIGAGCYMNLSSAGTFVKNIVWRNCIIGTNSVGINALEIILSGANTIVSNNLFENCNIYGYSTSASTPISTSTYFRNCNINLEPNTANNGVYDYCTFTTNNTTHYVTGSSNQFGKTLVSIYNGDVTQPIGNVGDAPWTLKTGSPAIGWGRDYSNNPIDGGAYGGADPYRLSGIPRIPSFYQLSSTAGAAANSNPYPITFSVRANN